MVRMFSVLLLALLWVRGHCIQRVTLIKATQSSTCDNKTANYAIDGNEKTNSCTDRSETPWLKVKFDKIQFVDKIRFNLFSLDATTVTSYEISLWTGGTRVGLCGNTQSDITMSPSLEVQCQNNPPALWVMIQVSNGTVSLQIREVMVTGAIDLATATQSSRHTENHRAQYAIDKVMSTLSHTTKEQNPWLTVTFSKVQVVEKVKFKSHTWSNLPAISYQISLFHKEDIVGVCGHATNNPLKSSWHWSVVKCERLLKADRMKIHVTSTEHTYIAFQEVAAFAVGLDLGELAAYNYISLKRYHTRRPAPTLFSWNTDLLSTIWPSVYWH